jgi:hypothetical protein
MRVDGCIHAARVPAAHRIEAQLVGERMKRAGVDEHEPVVGAYRRDVDERLEESDARRELFEHARPAEWMEVRLRGARFAAP